LKFQIQPLGERRKNIKLTLAIFFKKMLHKKRIINFTNKINPNMINTAHECTNMHSKHKSQKKQTMGSIYEDVHDLPNFSPFEVEDDDDACLSAMLLCCGPMIFTSVLKASIELNLFEIISKANPPCVSASYVASKLSTTQHPQLPRRLDRMLCLLASHSLLVCSTRTNEEGGSERFYELSLAGKYFVKDEKNGSVALFSSFMNHQKFMDAL
jgi:hypothetical protein